MREWPSIVPGAPEDFYLVINRYAFLVKAARRFSSLPPAAAWREVDLRRRSDRVAESARRPARRVYGAVIAREPPKSDSACRSASHSSSVNSGSSCGRNP